MLLWSTHTNAYSCPDGDPRAIAIADRVTDDHARPKLRADAAAIPTTLDQPCSHKLAPPVFSADNSSIATPHAGANFRADHHGHGRHHWLDHDERHRRCGLW